MIAEIPADLGRVIPDPVVLCVECREVRVKTSPDEPEPLCWGCRMRDDILPDLIFKGDDVELRERRFDEPLPIRAHCACGRSGALDHFHPGDIHTARCARCQVAELVVPVERQNMAPRVFGSGSGEIDSCELVLAMRHEAAVDRDAALCRRLTWAFCVFEGLLLLAASAAMR